MLSWLGRERVGSGRRFTVFLLRRHKVRRLAVTIIFDIVAK